MTIRTNKRKSVQTITAALTLAAYGASFNAHAEKALEEVIVTAQKKDDTLQTVPMTINAVTAETIAKYNLLDFKDIQSVTPGLTIKAQDSRTYSVALRGVNVLTDSGFSPSVAIYWNEVNYDIDSAYKAMYDVGQIEVLRGPQGTLRGITSPSGAITISTKAPSFNQIEGTVEQTFGERSLSNTQFGVSLPIIEDRLALRVAGIYDYNKNDGIENVVTGQENTNLTRSGRITLGLRATDNLEMQLVHQYLEANNSGLNSVTGCGKRNVTQCFDKFDRKSVAATNSNTFQRREDTTLRVEWNLGGASLISVTGYRDQYNTVNRNLDVGNTIPKIGSFGAPNPSDAQLLSTNLHSLTQEFRLSSNDADFYNWTYGLYASKQESNTFVGLKQVYKPFFGPTVPGPGILVVAVPTPFYTGGPVEGYAAFTNQSFAWTDKFETQIGIRYQNQRAGSLNQLNNPPPRAPTVLADTVRVDEGLTGTASASYQLTDDVRLYATYGHSFRPGGFTVAPQSPPELAQYDSEVSDSIELGFKSRLADGRVQLNGDIYYQKFNGFLARTSQSIRMVDPATQVKTTNFLGFNSDAEVSGAELQIDALLTDDWQVGMGLSYTDAKFTGGEGPCNVYVGGVVQDPPSGQPANFCTSHGRVTGEPNWAATANSEYTMHFGAIDTYLRALYSFQTGRSDDSVAGSVLDTSSYGVFNLFAGIRDPQKTWEVSVWAKNLFDHQQVVRYTPEATVGVGALNVISQRPFDAGALNPAALQSGYSEVQLIPERQFGITGKYNFSL